MTLLATKQKHKKRTKCIIVHLMRNIWCILHTEMWLGDAWQSTCEYACILHTHAHAFHQNKLCDRIKEERQKVKKNEKWKTTTTERTTPVIFCKNVHMCAILCTDQHEWVYTVHWRVSLSLFLFIVQIFRVNRTRTEPFHVSSETRLPSTYIKTTVYKNVLKSEKNSNHTHIFASSSSSFFHNTIQFREKQCNQTHAVNISLCRCLFLFFLLSCRIFCFC